MKNLFFALSFLFALGLSAQDAKKCTASKAACTANKTACTASAAKSGTVENGGISAESLKAEGFEVSTCGVSGMVHGTKVCANSGTTTTKDFNPSTGEVVVTKIAKSGEVLSKEVTVLEGNVKSAGNAEPAMDKKSCVGEKKAGCCANGASAAKGCCAKKP